jgi:uncharacterized membrane protein YkoI
MRVRALLAPFLGLLIIGCTSEHSRSHVTPPVPRAAAERIAIARVGGGSILDGHLEMDWGRPVWSFDIAMPGTRDRTEMQIDATGGQIVSMLRVTPPDEDTDR